MRFSNLNTARYCLKHAAPSSVSVAGHARNRRGLVLEHPFDSDTCIPVGAVACT